VQGPTHESRVWPCAYAELSALCVVLPLVKQRHGATDVRAKGPERHRHHPGCAGPIQGLSTSRVAFAGPQLRLLMCGDRAGRDTFPLTHTTDNQMYLRAFMDEDLRAVAGLSEVTCWPAKGGGVPSLIAVRR